MVGSEAWDEEGAWNLKTSGIRDGRARSGRRTGVHRSRREEANAPPNHPQARPTRKPYLLGCVSALPRDRTQGIRARIRRSRTARIRTWRRPLQHDGGVLGTLEATTENHGRNQTRTTSRLSRRGVLALQQSQALRTRKGRALARPFTSN